MLLYHDLGINTPGHGKEVVDGLNVVDKCYMYQLMHKFQLHGLVRLHSQIKMNTGTKKTCNFSSGIQRLSGKIAPPKWYH